MAYKFFTSESVASGHPDKIADQISDAVLDAVLKDDPKSRVAVETLVTTDQTILAGEVTTKSKADFEQIARSVIKDLGYTEEVYNFTHKSPVDVLVHTQSPDISIGVDDGGAGDQGMMFGFATNETKSYMPLPISIAHRLIQQLDEAREKNLLPYLRPDGKSEVTVSYENGKPQKVERVVLASAHDEKIENKELAEDLYQKIVLPILSEFGFKIDQKNVIVNGTGVWHIPGPASDTGLTGRKIVVDSYGGFGRSGGGAFSGKDPTKVDRSGAYVARYIAKNIVAANLADKVEVQIAYVIGQREPITRDIETFGTEKKSQKIIQDFAWSLIDLSVPGIIAGLDLLRPIYRDTASYGHFGRDKFPWEQIKS